MTPHPVHHDHDHEHAHGHGHAPTVSSNNERVVLTGFVLTAGFMLVEVVGGVLSGSLALIADAGHMLTDAAALLLAWVFLGQAIAPMQLLGAAIVIGTVMALGLRKR